MIQPSFDSTISEKEEFEQVGTQFQKLIDNGKKSFQVALMLNQKGQYNDSIKLYQAAQDIGCNHFILFMGLADALLFSKILFKNDKYKDSFEMLQELQIDETQIELFSLKLKCLEKQEDLERALACLNNLIENSEQTSLLFFVHASLLIKLGQLPEAIDSIFKSIQLKQLSDPLLQVHKNQIFQLLGRSINENKIDIQQTLNLIKSKPLSQLCIDLENIVHSLVQGISYIYDLRQCIQKFHGLINLNKIDFAKKLYQI